MWESGRYGIRRRRPPMPKKRIPLTVLKPMTHGDRALEPGETLDATTLEAVRYRRAGTANFMGKPDSIAARAARDAAEARTARRRSRRREADVVHTEPEILHTDPDPETR